MEQCKFEIIGEIAGIEPIAIRRSIRDIARLRKRYGTGRWRKLKGGSSKKWRPCIELRYIGTKPTGSGG